jgi:hypothetical protein
MFGFDTVIDSVQSGKKMWVSTFVTNEAIAKAMNSFVDAQTEYTKKAFKATADTATVLADETTKTVQKVSKFDYTKIFDTFAKK